MSTENRPPMVAYRYDNPGPAGPYKGRVAWLGTDRMTSGPVPRKGDSIAAPFGSATVTSVRASQK